MQSYEELLDQAKKALPDDIKETSRFEVPKVRGHVEGNKTILSNFIQIAETMHRPPKHLLKFVLKEIASPGEVVQNRVIIGSKAPASRINEAITKYADLFVYCKECGKPETKMTKEGDVFIIKCQACGARNSAYAK